MRGINGWRFCLENELHAATVYKCIEFLRMHAINVIYVESELQKERNTKKQLQKNKTTAAVTVNRLRAGKIKLQFVFGLCAARVFIRVQTELRFNLAEQCESEDSDAAFFRCLTFQSRASDSMNSLHSIARRMHATKHCSHDTKSYKSIY